MGKFFTDKTEEGIRLVWMQYEVDKIKQGRVLLQEAANEGDAEAYCFLARTYFGAAVFEEEPDKAFELLRKSVELGSCCGLLSLLQYKKTSSVIINTVNIDDRRKAVAEIEARANAGHAYCCLIMGMYYFWGGYWLLNELDINKEYTNEDKALDARLSMATPWFEKALYGGLTIALNNLTDIYEAYPGNEDKLEKALRFASEQGHPYYKERYANWLYDNDKLELSLKAFEELAGLGYARGWYDAGFQYERGLGTEQDNIKAISYYENGAKTGSSCSQVRLAKHLLWDKLIQKDEAQAYFWFCLAAEQGDEIAKMWKGHCLFYGLGVEKNEDEGTTLLFNALNYNYPGKGESQQMAQQSQFDWDEDMLQMFWDLGIAYESGLGMPKRESSAGYYFSMVANSGWPEAVEKMTHYKLSGFLKRWKRID